MLTLVVYQANCTVDGIVPPPIFLLFSARDGRRQYVSAVCHEQCNRLLHVIKLTMNNGKTDALLS